MEKWLNENRKNITSIRNIKYFLDGASSLEPCPESHPLTLTSSIQLPHLCFLPSWSDFDRDEIGWKCFPILYLEMRKITQILNSGCTDNCFSILNSEDTLPKLKYWIANAPITNYVTYQCTWYGNYVILWLVNGHWKEKDFFELSLIHIWRCRRIERCRSRWSPYH